MPNFNYLLLLKLKMTQSCLIDLAAILLLVWQYWTMTLSTLISFIMIMLAVYLVWLNVQRGSESQGKFSKVMQAKDEDGEGLDEEDEEEHGETLCGACGENYASDEFWICCDICEKWFHGKCVKITPARAEHIKQYKCPSCSNKRARPWWRLELALCVLCMACGTANCLVGQVCS